MVKRLPEQNRHGNEAGSAPGSLFTATEDDETEAFPTGATASRGAKAKSGTVRELENSGSWWAAGRRRRTAHSRLRLRWKRTIPYILETEKGQHLTFVYRMI